MKVCIQIIDNSTYQYGMIEENVEKGFEVQNALAHFGVLWKEVEWTFKQDEFLYGKVIGTTKIVSVVKVVSDQPTRREFTEDSPSKPIGD